MIPRYTRPEMAAIWEPQTRFRIWFEIEAHAADAMAELGLIPRKAAETIRRKGEQRRLRRATHRCHRARGQARCHRLPDLSGRDRRARRPLRASGHDLFGRARHLPECAAGARRPTSCSAISMICSRCCGAAPSNMNGHHLHRPQPRHSRRADDLRPQACLRLRRVRPRPRAAGRARREIATCAISGAVGTFANIDPRVEAHVAKAMGLLVGARVESDHRPRPPCRVFRDPGGHRQLGRASGHRNPPSAANRGSRSGGILLARAEGLLRHAAQAQSGAVGERDRACPPRPLGGHSGSRERGSLARARHLPFLRRARDCARTPPCIWILRCGAWRASSTSWSSIRTTCSENLDRLGGLIHSQRVMLALIGKGMGREEAYGVVQRNAMKAWHGQSDFLTLLGADADVGRLLDAARAQVAVRPRLPHPPCANDLPPGVRRCDQRRRSDR